MISRNEQISPAEFDLNDKITSGSIPSAADSSAHKAPRWVLPLLLALVVVAAWVVFWLPGRISQQPVLTQSVNAAGTASSTRAGTAPAKPAQAEASPWSDAQTAKLRKQAQDVLTDLLEAQSSLEKAGVRQWAADAFDKAMEKAAAGDGEYRERRFKEARVSYQQGLAELQALLELAPQVLQENLVNAGRAIDAGEGDKAQADLRIVATIEPGNESLPGLRQRLQVMTQLFNLLAQAERAESSSDLAQAVSFLQKAVALDAQSPQARSELKRVRKAYTVQRFNDAMSQGYLALNQGQFGQARTAFNKAARLVPGSAVAASGLEEVNSAETANRLAALQRRGQDFEAQEKWGAAVSVFEQALQIDGSLMIAQQGLQRARVRARLDQQLRQAIEKPERLSEKAVADATAQLLHQAESIHPRGLVLQQQLKRLKIVLEQANTPIVVTLRSDMVTEVTLRKVARLGHFEERVLSLRPGTYVAVGTRDGYRDVRRTFSVSHDSEPPSVFIACTEQI